MLTQIHYASDPDFRPSRREPRNLRKLTRQQMEAVRHSAAFMLLAGVSQADIARKYEVSRAAVSRWASKVKRNESLARTPTTGRPPMLSPTQIERLKVEYRSRSWTIRQFREVICLLTGVKYHADHVGKMMAAWRATENRPIGAGKSRRRRTQAETAGYPPTLEVHPPAILR